jgi:hypothetical protein
MRSGLLLPQEVVGLVPLDVQANWSLGVEDPGDTLGFGLWTESV